MKQKTASENTLLRILRVLTQNISMFVFIIILAVIQVSLSVYLPVLIGRVVNLLIGVDAVDFERVKRVLIQMILVIVLNTVIQTIHPRLYQRLVYEAIKKYRDALIEKVHSIPIANLDRITVGDLVSRIITDADQLGDGLLMVFNQFIIGVLTIIFTIITMGRLDVKMLMMILVLTPLSLIFARLISDKSYHLFIQQTETRGAVGKYVEETIQSAEVVRAFNAQEHMVESFLTLNEQYGEESLKATFISSITNPTTRLINALIYAVTVWIGSNRIISGTFTVGELTTFLNFVTQYTKPFNDISGVITEMQGALACAERLFEIMDLADEQEQGNHVLDTQIEGKITFNEVSFSYTKQRPLIQNLSLNVSPGDKVAIVGPTGAGKSTLVNLLMRFYNVDSGDILIDNQSVMMFTRESVRRNFGMVLQETWLKSATIHENIAYGYPNATRELVEEAARAAHADAFIQLLPQGYDTYLDDAGESLSVGQRQLLSIARIFVKVPQMLVLDEATSSIDTRTEMLIQKAFDQLMQNRTSFIIAHRLSTIQSADMILVMQNGNIVEQGKHDDLMKQKGLYYQLQQARYHGEDS